MVDVLGVFEQAVLMAVLQFRGDGYGRAILEEFEARLDRSITASAVRCRARQRRRRDRPRPRADPVSAILLPD